MNNMGQQHTPIALHRVTFTYAGATEPALRNVTLTVPAGQICAVIGRAGAGKSTLCALCAGFVPHFFRGRLDGDASVDGLAIATHPIAELVRHVALVGSNAFSQISGARFTVYDEVAFGLENLGVPREEMIARVEWALQALGIDHLRDRSPYALSGGQQQRMVIAAALAMRPPVLALDEPTAQLDPPAMAELADVLRALSRQGMTILVAEHRLEWVADVAERVVALDRGAVLADGAPADVLTDPRLCERGIGWTRPTKIAAQARTDGRWPPNRPLPITVADLVAGLRAIATGQHPASAQDGAIDSTGVQPTSVQRMTHSTEPIVTLDEVHFTYPTGVEALRGASLAVRRGERIALVGRNGAGKSTLVRHLNGLLRPSRGRALVNGIDTRTTTVARCARHVGVVFQDVRNQLFARTVRDEIRFGPQNLGFAPEKVEALTETAIDALDLRDVVNEHPYDLPPARRRLVAVAAVLAMDTALLVLDEPTAGLDNASIDVLARLIDDLATRQRSVLVVSHDLDFCYETLDRVVLMRDGRIALDKRFAELDRAQMEALDSDVGLPITLRLRYVNP
ncbi:ABC transporter related [Roseiflexus castenholzii DSM 13941]|jgi:energy-coupling factor transport system ATP-binding protein|uniref:ABC transporter related n=2 Tax=Roseiflexus castenholzii TaxID=120962 RepID=A7NS79_ROSCS|nr:ABC transporter related [Roseiflexus castenholzii DSM 13941]